MSAADALRESIKYDVDRLANIARLEELGLLTSEPNAAMVWVRLRTKQGEASEYFAVNTTSRNWLLHRDGAGVHGGGYIPSFGPWSYVKRVILESGDNPIVEHVVFYDIDGSRTFNLVEEA